jgi:NADH:ubiquinone oxidoreductase subunit E
MQMQKTLSSLKVAKVCTGKACTKKNCDKIIKELIKDGYEIKTTKCQDKCKKAPVFKIQK